MDSLDFSIVTPSYNQAEFIRETLNSVRNQRDVTLEHIVMDGGSTDETQRILESVEDEYNLVWRSEPDDGQSDAVNKGFELASGDIIGWLNSDDVYLTPTTLLEVQQCFDRFRDVDIIYGDAAEIDTNSQIRRLSVRPDFNAERLKHSCFISQPATFFRRSVVEQEQLRTDLEYCMDYEYWLRLSRQFDFKHISSFYSGFRRYPGQKSQTDKASAEETTMLQNYGIQTGKRLPRVLNAVQLTTEWRLRSVPPTISFYLDRPELAFDGSIASLRELVRNLFLPDQFVWD